MILLRLSYNEMRFVKQKTTKAGYTLIGVWGY